MPELDRLRKRQVASFVLQRFGLGAERFARGSERRVELRGERGWPRSTDLLPQCERRAVEPDRIGRVSGQRGEAADVLEEVPERPAIVVRLVGTQARRVVRPRGVEGAELALGVAEVVEPDCDHPSVADLATEPDRLSEALARLFVAPLERRDHPNVRLRDTKCPAVADLAAQLERAVVVLA